jgi:predicted RNA-binding Zn ribbon-like protein
MFAGNGFWSRMWMNVDGGRPKQGADPAFPRLLGERLCLNFANSVENRAGAKPEEFLRSYADLVRWGRHAGDLSVSEVLLLLAEGERRPDDAAATLSRALALREAIYRIFQAIANGDSPDGEDLATLHRDHLAALAQTRFTATPDGFALVWSGDYSDLGRVIWPVTRSAAELLLTGEPRRVKQCAGPDGGCGWLFYDESKNGSRRWCSMEGCGSSAKMRRYRARKRPGNRIH